MLNGELEAEACIFNALVSDCTASIGCFVFEDLSFLTFLSIFVTLQHVTSKFVVSPLPQSLAAATDVLLHLDLLAYALK